MNTIITHSDITITWEQALKTDSGTLLRVLTGGPQNLDAGETVIRTNNNECPFVTLNNGSLWGTTDWKNNSACAVYTFTVLKSVTIETE